MTDARTAMDTSALHWSLDERTRVRPFQPADAGLVFELVVANRAHLDRWLRWSITIQSERDVEDMIARYELKMATGDGFHSGIWVDDQLAGAVVCRSVDQVHRNAEIGYWLAAEFTGRGLATYAAKRATDYLFAECGLHRIEMQCGVDNVRSRAIPERLGYRLEGIRRESHWITTQFVDHAIYGILAPEWRDRGPGRGQ